MTQWAKQKQAGFTIVELLIVVVVIAILAAITIVAYNGISNRSKAAALQSELSQATKALASKRQLSGTETYPSSLADIGIRSTKLTYNYNSRSNTYCIDGKDGNIEYSVRGSTMKVEEGECIDHGMAIWLPFNGNTNDTSGNENTVTTSGSPSVTTGANGDAGGAYSFNSSSQYFGVQNADMVPSRTDRFTVSIWARGVSSTGSDYTNVVHKGNATSIGSSVFNLGLNAGASQALHASVNGEYTKGNSNVSGADGAWRHLVLVYAGGYQTVYVNGEQTNDASVGAITNPTTGTSLTIGAGVSGYRRLVGAVDDFRIYNRALVGAEVQRLYSQGAQ